MTTWCEAALLRLLVLWCPFAACPFAAVAQESGGTLAATVGYCRGAATADVEGGACLNVQLLAGLTAEWRAGLSVSSAWLAGRPEEPVNLYDDPPVHAADLSLVVQRHWTGTWHPWLGAGFGAVSARHREVPEPQSMVAPIVRIEAGTSWGTGRLRPAARVAYEQWLSDFIAAEGRPSRVLTISVGLEVAFEPQSP